MYLTHAVKYKSVRLATQLAQGIQNHRSLAKSQQAWNIGEACFSLRPRDLHRAKLGIAHDDDCRARSLSADADIHAGDAGEAVNGNRGIADQLRRQFPLHRDRRFRAEIPIVQIVNHHPLL